MVAVPRKSRRTHRSVLPVFFRKPGGRRIFFSRCGMTCPAERQSRLRQCRTDSGGAGKGDACHRVKSTTYRKENHAEKFDPRFYWKVFSSVQPANDCREPAPAAVQRGGHTHCRQSHRRHRSFGGRLLLCPYGSADLSDSGPVHGQRRSFCPTLWGRTHRRDEARICNAFSLFLGCRRSSTCLPFFCWSSFLSGSTFPQRQQNILASISGLFSPA